MAENNALSEKCFEHSVAKKVPYTLKNGHEKDTATGRDMGAPADGKTSGKFKNREDVENTPKSSLGR